MSENENITTYPEEPTNPSGYTGFNKSVERDVLNISFLFTKKC